MSLGNGGIKQYIGRKKRGSTKLGACCITRSGNGPNPIRARVRTSKCTNKQQSQLFIHPFFAVVWCRCVHSITNLHSMQYRSHSLYYKWLPCFTHSQGNHSLLSLFISFAVSVVDSFAFVADAMQVMWQQCNQR